MDRLTLDPVRLCLLEGGTPWSWKGTLTWPLYGLWLTDQAACRAVAQNRRSVGANTVCCASMLYWPHAGTAHTVFGPSTPHYHEQLRPFAAMLQAEGLRLCLVALCDTAQLLPDRAGQRAHWQWLYTALGDFPNVTLVLANQPGHHTQAISVGALHEFEPPPSIAGFPPLLASPYNPHEDELPLTLPGWAFSCFCSKRNEPNWWAEGSSYSMATVVSLGSDGRPPTRQQTVLFEPPPAGRRPEWSDAGKWRQFARALAFKGTVGGNFYSDADAQSVPYSGATHNCAVEFLGNVPAP